MTRREVRRIAALVAGSVLLAGCGTRLDRAQTRSIAGAPVTLAPESIEAIRAAMGPAVAALVPARGAIAAPARPDTPAQVGCGAQGAAEPGFVVSYFS